MSDPARAEQEEPRLIRILEADPDLGADLNGHTLAKAAGELLAPVFDVQWRTRTAHWGFDPGAIRLGVMVIDGLVVREVSLLGTSSAELIGAGDLLRPADVYAEPMLPLPAQVGWTALAPLRVAALDGVFLAAACRYPQVMAQLVGRTVARSKALGLHEAVRNLKHVDTRLLVQLWHLAERWGRVNRDGVTVDLPLTHELLGKLVGAARPTVTTALSQLAREGLVTRDGRGWRLSHDSRLAIARAARHRAGRIAP
jgi:CRP/FNR family transcriptional regulator, cyclic AMP receptor protein